MVEERDEVKVVVVYLEYVMLYMFGKIEGYDELVIEIVYCLLFVGVME